MQEIGSLAAFQLHMELIVGFFLHKVYILTITQQHFEDLLEIGKAQTISQYSIPGVLGRYPIRNILLMVESGAETSIFDLEYLTTF